MNAIPPKTKYIGGSGGGGGGIDRPNNLFSNSTCTIMDILSEGPIYGLCTGDAQCIYLNNAQLSGANGPTNLNQAAPSVATVVQKSVEPVWYPKTGGFQTIGLPVNATPGNTVVIVSAYPILATPYGSQVDQNTLLPFVHVPWTSLPRPTLAHGFAPYVYCKVIDPSESSTRQQFYIDTSAVPVNGAPLDANDPDWRLYKELGPFMFWEFEGVNAVLAEYGYGGAASNPTSIAFDQSLATSGYVIPCLNSGNSVETFLLDAALTSANLDAIYGATLIEGPGLADVTGAGALNAPPASGLTYSEYIAGNNAGDNLSLGLFGVVYSQAALEVGTLNYSLGFSADAGSSYFGYVTVLVAPTAVLAAGGTVATTAAFGGVTAALVLGYPEQQPLVYNNANSAGDTAYVVNVGIEVQHDTGPVVQGITDNEATSILVSLAWAALLITDTKNGNINDLTVAILIETRVGDGAWLQAFNGDVTGKCSSTYEQSWKVLRPAGTGDWQVRVTRLTPDATETNQVDAFTWATYTVCYDYQFQYPNTAYALLTFDAALFGGSLPTRNYLIYGRLIAIPSNYDPLLRSYSGVWDGTFQTAYTNNPAWVFYDLLINPLFGCGEMITPAMVDIWTLYTISQWCDQMVPDGQGGMEPLYTFNGIIDTQQDALKVLAQVASVFDAVIYANSLTVSLVQDVVSDPQRVFTAANVINGEFMYEGTSLSTRPTVIRSRMIDPLLNWVPTLQTAKVNSIIHQYGYFPQDIQLLGVTSRGQAQRKGLNTIYLNWGSGEVATFTIGLDAADLLPGDTILLADPIYEGVRFGGRLAPGTTSEILVLDQAVPIDAGTSYVAYATLPDGSVETQQVLAIGTGATDQAELEYDENFAAETELSASISSFTRTSPATFTNADGLIYTVAANVPRFDHNSAGTLLGLLMEPAATNLIPSSGVIDTTNWFKLDPQTFDGGYALAPDGTTNARSMSSSAASGLVITPRYGIPVTPNTTYTLSVWVKLIGGSYQSGTTLTAIASSGGSSPTYDGAVVTADFGNLGVWSRLKYTFNTGSSDTELFPYLTFGVGSSVQIDLWGMQLEVGSGPTSFIYTTTGPATRAQDTLQASLSPAISAGGTLVFEHEEVLSTQKAGALLIVSNANNGDNITLNDDGEGNSYFTVKSGSTTTTNATYPSPQNTAVRRCLAWGSDGFTEAHDGVLDALQAVAVPATINLVVLQANNPIWARRLSIFDLERSGTDLSTISQIGFNDVLSLTNATAGAYCYLASPLSLTPQVDAVWCLANSEVSPRTFKVLTITEKTDATFEIKAAFFDSTRFDKVVYGTSITLPNYTTVPTGPPVGPSNVSWVVQAYYNGLQTIPEVLVSWTKDPSPTVNNYEVQWQGPNDTQMNTVGFTGDSSFLISNIRYDGSGAVQVRSIDIFGNKSPFITPGENNGSGSSSGSTSSSISITTLNFTPDNVNGFSVTVSGDSAQLAWDAVSQNSLCTYSIYFSGDSSTASLQNSVLLASGIASTAYTVPYRPGTYFVVAVANGTGTQSAVAASAAATTASTGKVMQTITCAPSWTVGTPVSATISGNNLVGQATGTSSYTFVTEDLGAVYQACRLIPSLAFTNAPGAKISSELLVAVSLDGETFGEPAQLGVADLTGRMFQITLQMTSEDGVTIPTCSEFTIGLLLPQATETGDSIDVPAAGLTIEFLVPFAKKAVIALTPQNLQSGDYYTITGKTKTGFTVQFFNSSGTGVDRITDYTATGVGQQVVD